LQRVDERQTKLLRIRQRHRITHPRHRHVCSGRAVSGQG
jgi:hypothetical protein